MMKVLITLALIGCAPSAAQIRERELCYARVEAEAQKRVDTECAVSFATCPAAKEILDELRAAQEACP